MNKEETIKLTREMQNNSIKLIFNSKKLPYKTKNAKNNKIKSKKTFHLCFIILIFILFIFLIFCFSHIKILNIRKLFISNDAINIIKNYAYNKINNNNIFYNENSYDYNIEINLTNNDIKNEDLKEIKYEKQFYTKFEFNRLNFYLKEEVIEKFNKYINICYNNTLIDKKKYPLLKNPKITAIIPLYNAKKYLFYSLRSIQNQKMKEIEIILVDDCSKDNTSKIIEEYMKEDERIRLIKNEKSRKILYSKSIGALNARGKYIMELDQDDLFIEDDIFDILYYEAEKNNLDLVQISDICKHNLYFQNGAGINYISRHFIFPQKEHYKTQPELKNTNFRGRNNYLLWGLLIKSDIYKKVVYRLWPIIINYKLTFQEDYFITSRIAILAQRYKYLNIFSLLHLKHDKATHKLFHIRKNLYFLGSLFVQYNFYDDYIKNNPKEIRLLLFYMNYFKNSIYVGGHYNFKFYHYNMYKIKDNEYLSDKDKEFLKKIFREKKPKEFKIWDTYHYLEENNEYEEIYNYQNAYSIDKFKQKEKKEKNNEVKISIVIICSEYNYLEKTLKSIENQKFEDYEIIIVFDNNDTSSLDLINNYINKNNFSNIKIINNGNKDIRGNVYSVSIGVLSSNGEYTLVLESSYTFAKQTSLGNIYDLTKKGINNTIDILEFNMLVNTREHISKNSLSLYKCQHMKSVININEIKYNTNYTGIDQQKELLSNKLIKTNLFKTVINKYKFNEIQRKVFNYYDDIFLFALKSMNYTFEHIETFGIIQNINNLNSLNINNITNDKNRKIKDTIFYINFLFENSPNTIKGKKKVVEEFFNVMNIIYNRFTKISDESRYLYEKFMNSIYINESDKNTLKFYFNSLII